MAFAPYRNCYTPSGYADTVLGPATIHQRLAAMTVLVAATDAGEIVGTIGCQAMAGGEGHLRGMAVHPLWQGTGPPQRQLDAALHHPRRHGRRRLTPDTTEPRSRA